MNNRIDNAPELTLERAQELAQAQQNGTLSWSDIYTRYGFTRYRIKHLLDVAQHTRNVKLSTVLPVPLAEFQVATEGTKTMERQETEGRFIKPRFIPHCLACRKQTASLQYNGYFCSLECAAIWALDYLQTSTTPEWCPFCKTWLVEDLSLLLHIYTTHPLQEENKQHES